MSSRGATTIAPRRPGTRGTLRVTQLLRELSVDQADASEGVRADGTRQSRRIGIVSVRIAEMVLNDERAVVPIGSFQRNFGVTKSLPSVVGRGGAVEVLQPEMSDEERSSLQNSAKTAGAAAITGRLGVIVRPGQSVTAHN
jgi:hypothetical protein